MNEFRDRLDARRFRRLTPDRRRAAGGVRDRPPGDGLVAGAGRLEPALDECDLGDRELVGERRSEHLRHAGPTCTSGECQVADESFARRFAEVLRRSLDGSCQLVEPGHGDHEGATAHHVDRGPSGRRAAVGRHGRSRPARPPPRARRPRPGTARSCASSRADEADATLVFATQRTDVLDHLLGWPHRDEQPCHPSSQTAMPSAPAMCSREPCGVVDRQRMATTAKPTATAATPAIV